MSIEYYDVGGTPGVYEGTHPYDGTVAPKTFVNGKWITRHDAGRFFGDAYPISKQRFDEMVAQQRDRANGS